MTTNSLPSFFKNNIQSIAILKAKQIRGKRQYYYSKVTSAFLNNFNKNSDEILNKRFNPCLFGNKDVINWIEELNTAMEGNEQIFQIFIESSKIWTEVLIFPISKNLVGISLTNISEQLSTMKILTKQEKELLAIYESSPVLMLVVDRDRNIIKINRAALKYFNKSSQEVIKTKTGEAICCINALDNIYGCGFSAQCANCAIRNTVNNVIESGEAIFGVEGRLHTKINGADNLIDIIVSASPMMVDEGPYILVCIQDITELKKAQRELEKAYLKAKGADELKGFILANISHEIRTPLNAIVGFSDLIAQMCDQDEGKNISKMIDQASAQLTSVIDNLILASSLDEITSTPEIIDFKLESLLKDISKTSPDLIILDISRKISCEYSGPKMLVEILINQLVDNALKFSNDKILIQAKEVNNIGNIACVQITIEDHGIGIKEEEKIKLLDFFEQAENVHTRKFGGLGIGLAVVKKIIDSLGGTFLLESSSGKGTKATIRLHFTKSTA